MGRWGKLKINLAVEVIPQYNSRVAAVQVRRVVQVTVESYAVFVA